MITFIPSWLNPSYNGLSSDDLIGQIKAFQTSGEEYQVIIKDYIPSLRYFLHHYDLLECNYMSVFDYLQGSKTFDQVQVRVEELPFFGNLSYHFTPHCMLVYREGEEIGRIYFGEASYIQEVHYIEKGVLVCIETYDDRGFVSCRKIINKDQSYFTEYLDVEAVWIFRVQENGQCRVNPRNSKGLNYLTYSNIEDIQSEYMDYLLEDNDDSPIIVALDTKNASWIENSPLKSCMTLSLFRDRYPYSKDSLRNISIMSKHIHAIAIDNEVNFKKITTIINKKCNAYLLSPFDTRFRLSKTQEYEKEVIYSDFRKINQKNYYVILKELIHYYRACFLKNNRYIHFVIRVSNNLQQEEIRNQIKRYLEANYNKDLEQFLFYEKEVDNGEEFSEDALGTELSGTIEWIKNFYENLEILVINTDDEFFKWMNVSRLIIDLGNEPDLFTQIAGLSAGIPQINNTKSLYVQHKKNGWIIDSTSDLQNALIYYLDTLSKWQESRAYSVSQIKYYSGTELQRKLTKIVQGNN